MKFNYHNLTDITLMKYHRFFKQAKSIPWGYKKFPSVGEKVAVLEEIMMQRIPAEFTNEILKLTQHA